MITPSSLSRRTPVCSRFTWALLIGFVTVSGASVQHGAAASAQAQPQSENTCGLLTADEVQKLAPEEHVDNGVPSAQPALESFSCRYTWGTGIGERTLAVSIDPASRAFAGMDTEAIKRNLASSVRPSTSDAAVSEVGEGAVFKAYSAAYVGATAYVKGRILQVTFAGIDAQDRKNDVISLLKSAASRY
jgi:hypothetical protein